MNPYDVLGVSPKANADEISAAFKVLVQIFHPDRYETSPEAVKNEVQRRMKQLNEAYLALRTTHRPVTSGWTGSNGEGPSGGAKTAPSGGWTEPTVSATRVSWDQSERQRAAMARRAEEARQAAESSAAHGDARAMPKLSSERSAVVFGLGRALPTGKLPCRGCGSIQILPAGWQDLLDSHNFFCSSCGRLILCVERPSTFR